MKGLTTTGARIIVAIPILIFGIFHFMNASQMAGIVPFPPAQVWVYLTGVAHILAAIALIINQKAKLAALLLALMLFVFILGVHLPVAIGAEEAGKRQGEIMNTLKNLIMIGGLLAIAGLEVIKDDNEGSSSSAE